MELYLVTENTSGDYTYGICIECFGVATNKDELSKLKWDVAGLGFTPKVTVIDSGITVRKELGEYLE